MILNSKTKRDKPLLFIKCDFIFVVFLSFIVCVVIISNLARGLIIILFSLLRCMVLTYIPLKVELVQRLSYSFGVRFVGYLIMVLCMVIMVIVYLSQIELIGVLKSFSEMKILRSLIIFFRFIRFLVLKILYFYVFFELSLVPIFLMILG
jgi:NADH:ubiquinone oxidoreductase subunit 4 (subunit M)